MVKNVVLYGNHVRMHSFLKLLILNPPKGYKFQLSENKFKKKILKFLIRSKLIKYIYRNSLKKIFPSKRVYTFFSDSKLSPSFELIFSEGNVLEINQPWILEILDHPACMAGYNYTLFLNEINNLEKKLSSPFCKRIILVNESSLNLMKKYFSKRVIKKCILLRAGVLPEKNKKNISHKGINILFIGSIANPDDFYIKGGLEALESFKIVSEQIQDIHLFFRCMVPKEIKKKYEDVKGLIFLEEELNQDEWKKIVRSSDICLNPGHVYPLMATLEAMNNGLPIIMLDTWGVRDYLKNNFNSILVKPSEKIKEYNNPSYPLEIRSKKFIQEIKTQDSLVIERLCTALLKLIFDIKLRKKIGLNGKKTILKKFNLHKRNKVLKDIFDSALKN